MSLSLQALKDGDADTMLSCGNTGCLMAGGAIKLRTLEGVERPALCTIWPGRERYFTLLDAGANPHAKPFHIAQSAVLGSNYARVALGLVRPKVGLLTIGTEEGKGNEVIHETHAMLKDIDGSILNYAGLIEGFQIFENVVDVVVCDGFVGNIVLKACESLSKLIGSFLDEELRRNALRKTGALLSKGAFRSLKQRINPEQFGGAPLLGLTKNVIKAHGSSNRNHVSGAIKIALDLVQHDMLNQVLEDIRESNEILRPEPLTNKN
jgi:glycerol-3-phosphate acyltransferase PlsX